MILNELQIIYIREELKKRGLTFKPLEDEILDHFCCCVEQRMEEGVVFKEAFEKTADIHFSESQLEKIQSDTQLITSAKHRFLTFTSSLAASITALLAIILFTNATDAPSIRPFEASQEVRMTSPFGMRMHPIKKVKTHHDGVDFGMPEGTPILAAADGVIEKVKISDKGYGNLVNIKHDQSFNSIYAQLSEILVKEGQSVKQGEIIAYSGNSGASTAPHLHYEVLKDGKHVNPEDYFQEKE